jgi:hypothetical protein
MAQSELTVTPPSPTPPTNMSFTGATGPNPPNYTKVNYAEPFGARDASGAFLDEAPPGVRVNVNPPPYADDGAAGPLHTFAANAAALAGGTGATSGGTENTYPGIGGLTPPAPNMGGAVPAATSVAHEGAGTETTALAPGNITHTYVVGTLDMSRSASTGPVATAATRAAGPNASHASSDSVAPAAAPTITGLLPVAPVSNASGTATTTLTVNGTNFRNGAVVLIGGVAYPTQYNSPTQLKVLNAPVRAAAGNTAITVKVGATTTAATNWVFS